VQSITLKAAHSSSKTSLPLTIHRSYVFIHLDKPADKLALLLQMLHKLYALVRPWLRLLFLIWAWFGHFEGELASALVVVRSCMGFGHWVAQGWLCSF